ncbi:hypothetical protein J31TS6_16610 [Brevibacillus reuszeri]|nr:hypothetical protein J31TS6_16610 [Brevibacillus reuszeri]
MTNHEKTDNHEDLNLAAALPVCFDEWLQLYTSSVCFYKKAGEHGEQLRAEKGGNDHDWLPSRA